MRRVSSGFGILLVGILGGAPALAGATFELRDLYRDARMKAMGGAGIALPLEDRDAVQGVFTNPAQMAGNENLTLHYVNGDVSASWDTYTSLGDVHTMILYPAMASHRDLSPKHRERLGIHDNLVRMSVGIEAIEDILADLDQAFTACN